MRSYKALTADYPDFVPASRQLFLLGMRMSPSESGVYDVGQKLRRIFPNDPAIAGALGRLELGRGDLPRATQLLKEAVAKTPGDASLHVALGQAYFKAKQMKDAKTSLEKSLTLQPQGEDESLAKQLLGQIK